MGKAEKRTDNADGVAYTWQQLADYYGEVKATKIWDAAGKRAAAPKAKAKAKVKAKAKATAKKYSKIQCIAYEISTRPTGMHTRSTADDFYKGVWGDKNGPCWEDAAARVQLFKEALEAAAASEALDKSAGTLKVFMAPEFLLRGPRGAYQLDALLGTASKPGLFSELSALVKGEAWKHWLVVFGTAVGYVEEPSAGAFPCYNCAAVQLGGWTTEKERLAGSIAVMKTFKSGIDFLKDPQSLLGSTVALAEVKHMGADEAQLLVGKRHLDRDGVFELGGVTIGLEICLDHACQRLKLSTPEPGNNLVQLQLIPSCGMSLQYESICTQKGGVCFGCDGLSSGYDGQPSTGAATHSQVYVVPGGPSARFKAKAQGGENTYLKKTHLDEKSPTAKVSAHGDNWKEKLGELYDVSVPVAPAIAVYPTLKLPPKYAVQRATVAT